MKKVRIGDTIQWKGDNISYTIKDIRKGWGRIDGEILLEWVGDSGNITTWCYSWDQTNEYVNRGVLILESPNFSPHQKLKKHKLI